MPKLVALGLTEEDFHRIKDQGQSLSGSPTPTSWPKTTILQDAPMPARVLGGCFVLLFIAFLALQSFLTSVLPKDDGFIALAVLYGSFACMLNFTSLIIKRLGLKLTMGLSASTYTFLNVTVALAAQNDSTVLRWLVFLGSSLCGMGAGLLWPAQSAYCTAVAQIHKETSVERIQTAFFAALSMCGIFGFAITLFLIDSLGTSDYVMLITLACISALAAASFVFLPPLSPVMSDADKASAELVTTWRKVWEMLSMFRKWDMVLLAVPFFHLGALQGLMWATVTASMSSSLLSRAYIFHGICSVVSYFLSNASVISKSGCLPVSYTAKMLFFISLGTTASVLAALGLHSDVEDKADLLFGGIVLFGAFDFATQALLKGLVGREYTGSPLIEAASSYIQFMQTMGSVSMFVAGPLMLGWHQAVGASVLGVMSSLCLSTRAHLKAT